MPQATIPLGALSAAQRGLVEQHLPLVRLAMRRVRRRVWRCRSLRDERDLFQEGALVLSAALRSHDPARHGGFEPYALSRIEFALSRYVQEHGPAIRVPMITQRRQRLRQRALASADRHDPGAVPRVVRYSETATVSERSASGRTNTKSDGENAGACGGDEELGERLGRVMNDVLEEMKRSPFGRRGYDRVVEVCARQRWMIPEPTAQTSLRVLARELGCSVGRLTRCERRFRAQVARRLKGGDDRAVEMERMD